jgi:hypothetical protein
MYSTCGCVHSGDSISTRDGVRPPARLPTWVRPLAYILCRRLTRALLVPLGAAIKWCWRLPCAARRIAATAEIIGHSVQARGHGTLCELAAPAHRTRCWTHSLPHPNFTRRPDGAGNAPVTARALVGRLDALEQQLENTHVRRSCKHDTTAALAVDAVCGDAACGTRNGGGRGPASSLRVRVRGARRARLVEATH